MRGVNLLPKLFENPSNHSISIHLPVRSSLLLVDHKDARTRQCLLSPSIRILASINNFLCQHLCDNNIGGTAEYLQNLAI